MKKKTIVFLCLAILFLFSVPGGGIISIGFCALFAFLAYRSFKMSKADTTAVKNSSNAFTPKPNNSSLSTIPQHNTESVPITANVATPTDTACPKPEFEYIEVELINTNSKSDNGINKQALLKAFDNLEPPFDKKSFDNGLVEASFREYLCNDKRTYGVYLNGIQIGDIPEYLTQYIYDRMELCHGICDIDSFIGKNKEYCAKITLKFSNAATTSPPPEAISSQATGTEKAPSQVSSKDNYDNYEFVTIKVVGVTFKNEKGPTRQTILRKIRFNDKPFEKYVELGLRQYEFDGKPAYGVYANNMQIGNIPADYVQFIDDNMERLEGICNIDVYGGGRNEQGYAISYGCKITLKYRKNNE